MKAIVQDRYGSADVLEFRDVPEPAVGEDEVRIQVRAAGAGPALPDPPFGGSRQSFRGAATAVASGHTFGPYSPVGR